MYASDHPPVYNRMSWHVNGRLTTESASLLILTIDKLPQDCIGEVRQLVLPKDQQERSEFKIEGSTASR